MLKRIFATGVRGTLLLGPCAVQSNECEDMERGIGGAEQAKSQTVLNNGLDVPINGVIVRNGNVKKAKELGPGEKMSFTASIAEGNNYPVNMTAHFSREVAGELGATKTLAVDYTYMFRFEQRKTKNEFKNFTCTDPTVMCDTCQIKCERGYDAGKNRWHIDIHLVQ